MKNMEKILGFTKKSGLSIVSLALPLIASAQQQLQFPFTGRGTGPGPATQPSGGTTPPSAGLTSVQSVLNYVCVAFDWAFWFLIALAVLFGIIAAFKYLTAGGNPENVKAGNNTLLYAAIAVAVALLARGIPLIVASFFAANGSLQSC